MMQPVHGAASAIAGRRACPSRRRKAHPDLEVLETRLVLSPYVWTGLDSKSPTLWNDPGNWLGGQVPTAGSAVLFQAEDSQTDGSRATYPTGTTVDIDSADVSSITVQDNYTLEGDQSSASFGQLTLDSNATITTSSGDKLTFADDLKLDGYGGTTESGAGTVEIDEQGQPDLNLTQVTVSSGTLSVPQTTEFGSTLITVDASATLEVGEGTHSTIGSLNGDGTVDMDGYQATLAIDTPQNESDVFAGSFGGVGGTIQMEGAGTLTIGNISSDDPGDFEDSGGYQLDVGSGTVLLTGQASLQDLVPLVGGTDTSALEVEGQATFGGPGAVTVAGQAVFDDGSTYAVDLDGPPSTGPFTTLTDSPAGGDQLQIGAHTMLSISTGSGYQADQQDNFPIISTGSSLSGTVTGSFTTVTTPANVPFNVNYASDFFNRGIVTVAVQPEASVTKTTVALDPSSKSPLVYGQTVKLDATVAVAGDGTETPTGTVMFYDGTPGAGGVPIGTAQTLSNGHASISTASVSAGTRSIYAVYTPDVSHFVGNTSSQPASVIITPITLTVTGVTAEDKVYDGTTAAALDSSQAKLSGILSGDSVTLSSTGSVATFAGKNVGDNKPVTVTFLALTGAQAGDYIVSPPAGPLSADITPAPLTITANDESMASGGPSPALTVSYSGFVGGDTAASLSAPASVSTTATASSPAGTYPIVVVGAASPDYSIRFVDGTLTIKSPSSSAQGASTGSAAVRGVTIGKKAKGKHKVERVIVVTMSGLVQRIGRAATWATTRWPRCPAARRRASRSPSRARPGARPR